MRLCCNSNGLQAVVRLEKTTHRDYTYSMTTTLPADPETERLARNIAEATGKPLPTVVKEAIAAKAEADGVDDDREQKGRKKLDFTKVNAIIERAATRPVLDPRTADEIIGYNAHGLPE
jgi:antitoxin VapB